MINKLLALSLFAAMVVAIAGCGSGTNGGGTVTSVPKTAKEKIIELEITGKIPKLERESGLAGIDSNANGVRDDIESYINDNYPVEVQRAAAMQAAKAAQKTLLVDIANIIAVKAVKRETSRAINCIYKQFDGSGNSKQPARVSKEIRSMTTNTKSRLLAYLAYSKALDGTSWAMPEGDTCE